MWLVAVASVWVSAGLKITSHNCFGARQWLIDGSLQPGQDGLRMWALKSLLGPAQPCILWGNLSQDTMAPSLSFLIYITGITMAPTLRGVRELRPRSGPSAWHREGLGEGGRGPLFQPREGQGLLEATQHKVPQDTSALRSPPHQSTAR